MSVRMQKNWLPFDEHHIGQVKGQLGVFQIGDEHGQVQYIGCADARSLFGLKGELQSWSGKAHSFRIEVTSAYQTRYRGLWTGTNVYFP